MNPPILAPTAVAAYTAAGGGGDELGVLLEVDVAVALGDIVHSDDGDGENILETVAFSELFAVAEAEFDARVAVALAVALAVAIAVSVFMAVIVLCVCVAEAVAEAVVVCVTVCVAEAMAVCVAECVEKAVAEAMAVCVAECVTVAVAEAVAVSVIAKRVWPSLKSDEKKMKKATRAITLFYISYVRVSRCRGGEKEIASIYSKPEKKEKN